MIRKLYLQLVSAKNDNTIVRYYLYIFFKDFAFFSAVLVPFFTGWGHISLLQVQILQSWFMLCWFLLEVPTGAVADFLGRKYSLVLGSVTCALGAALYGSIPNFFVFMLGEFIFALGNALMSGADSALIYDTLKEQVREKDSKRIMGKAYSFYLLGILVSAPMGSVIASKFGLNAPMYLSAIPSLAGAAIALTMKEPSVHGSRSESNRYLDVIKKGFVFFRDHKILRLMALDGILVASSAYFVIWLYQPILESLHAPVYYFGFFHALMVGVEMLVSYNFTRLEELFGSAKSFLGFSALVTAIAFFLVAVFPTRETVILLLILGGGFGLTRLEYLEIIMNKWIPSDKRATVLSSVSMFRQFALVILNPAVGLMADHSLRGACIFVGSLSLIIFLFSPLEKKMLEE